MHADRRSGSRSGSAPEGCPLQLCCWPDSCFLWRLLSSYRDGTAAKHTEHAGIRHTLYTQAWLANIVSTRAGDSFHLQQLGQWAMAQRSVPVLACSRPSQECSLQGTASRVTTARCFRAPPSWRCQPAHQPAVVQRQQRRSLSGRAAPVNVQCWLRAPEKAWHAQRTTADGRQPAVCQSSVESSLTLRCVSRRTSSAALPAPPAGCCRDKAWHCALQFKTASPLQLHLTKCCPLLKQFGELQSAQCPKHQLSHRGQPQRLLNAALGGVPGTGHSVGEGVPPVGKHGVGGKEEGHEALETHQAAARHLT